MNKKLFSVILIFLLSSMIFVSTYPSFARIGDAGDTFLINGVDFGRFTSETHDGSTSNHVWKVGDYWYKQGMEYFTGGTIHRWFFVSASGDDLTTWADASSKYSLGSKNGVTHDNPTWTKYNAIWDDDAQVWHCVYADSSTGFGNSRIYYVTATPDEGAVTFSNHVTVRGSLTQGSNVAITVMDGKPVIAACSLDNLLGDGLRTYVFYSSDGVGSSWLTTIHPTPGGFHMPSVHAINSTAVYVIYQISVGDDTLFGFASSATVNGTSSFTEVTDENVEQDGIEDSNTRVYAGYSPVSINIVDPSEYAELIHISYVNTTKFFKFLSFNVTSETISGNVETLVYGGTWYPIFPQVAQFSNVVYAGYWHRVNNTHASFRLYEKNLLGSWSDYVHVDWGLWGAAKLLCSTMTKSPHDHKLIVTWEEMGTDNIYGADVEALHFEISADLEDVDDAGADWVFTDWKYYRFNVTVYLNVENLSFRFTVPTGEENIACGFFSNGTDWIYESNMTYEHREGEPCILKAGSWSQNTTETVTSATFDIWFNGRILDVWSGGIDIYGTYDNNDWFLINSNFFRIYSKGGFEMNYAATGDAGKLAGGTAFSLYANNGSIVYNEIWYRDGQHIKLMPDIHFLTGLDPFYIRYGVDYSLGDGEWLEGWNLYINPKFVSYTGIFAANVWINMTNIWNNRGSHVDDEDLYMFYHGSVSGVGDSGHWKSWVDLWFSDKNASKVGAGRYNAYEYPMIDSADLWLRWLANNWGAKDNVLKEMSMEAPLLDTDNITMISSESIKMMRFWCELEVDDEGAGQYVSIENYEAFDISHSRELPLLGMSNPVFDETLIPTVGQRGILGSLWSLFAGLSQWLSENVVFGGLNLWGTFVNFLDTIAAMVGAPKFFTNLFSWMAELIGYLVVSAGYIGTIATSIFSLVGALLGTFLTTMGDLVSSLMNTLTIFTDMMGGAYGAGVDVWDAFGISSWITVAMVFYPLYLLILWEERGMDAVLQQLGWIFGILSWLFGFFVTLIQFTIRLITTVIESIPVAE